MQPLRKKYYGVASKNSKYNYYLTQQYCFWVLIKKKKNIEIRISKRYFYTYTPIYYGSVIHNGLKVKNKTQIFIDGR